MAWFWSVANLDNTAPATLVLATAKIVIVTIRDHWYGINAEYVSEVSRMLQITNVPWTPGYVAGVVNLRGNIHSTVDIGVILGESPVTLDQTKKIVMCKSEDFSTGMIVDEMYEIIDIDENAIEPAISTLDVIRTEYISGVFELSGSVVSLLNLPRIIEKLKSDVGSNMA